MMTVGSDRRAATAGMGGWTIEDTRLYDGRDARIYDADGRLVAVINADHPDATENARTIIWSDTVRAKAVAPLDPDAPRRFRWSHSLRPGGWLYGVYFPIHARWSATGLVSHDGLPTMDGLEWLDPPPSGAAGTKGG